MSTLLPEPELMSRDTYTGIEVYGYDEAALHAHAAAVTADKDSTIAALKEVRQLHEAEIAAQDAEIERLRADAARLDFQQNNIAYEFSAEDDDGELVWVAYKVIGGRNDREWHKVGDGRNLREAIDAALKESKP